jgi:molecular chaperone GrpE (heat shock protein)
MEAEENKAPKQEPELEKEGGSFDKLYQRLTKLETTIAELTQLFKEKIDHDEAKKKLIEIMTTQLQQYEKNFVFEKFQKRVFLDLIQLFDRIEDVKRHVTSSELEDFCVHLDSFQTEILQILGRHGVTLIENAPKRFNEDFQEAIVRKSTPNPEEDNLIVEVTKRGFLYQGVILLRPEMVAVAKYEERGGKEENG